MKTAEEQEAEMADRKRQEAEERVQRRERMGHKPQDEPALQTNSDEGEE